MKTFSNMIRALVLGVVAALAAGPFASAQVLGPGAPAPAGQLRIDLTGDASQSVALPRGKSMIVDLPRDVRSVHVTNPAVADVAIPYARRFFIMGIASGQTDALFFDGEGRRILALNIRVEADLGGLSETISRVAPGAKVFTEAVNDRIILTGSVPNMADADRIVRVAASYTAKPENVLNMMTVAGRDQVILKVRIVEMQRNVLKQFGVNTNALVNQIGGPQYIFGNSATFAINGGIQGGLKGGYTLDTTKQPMLNVPCAPGVDGTCKVIVRGPQDASNFNTAVQGDTVGSNNLNKAEGTLLAFERVGVLRTLAEPTLTAVSGESSKFLAGGEFPVPTGVDNSGRTSIEFKQFGVGLGFTPIVLSEGRISLKISTEVSDVTSLNAFTIQGRTANEPSLTVPGLTVDRAETSIELASGEQMMIAGLIRENTRQNLDGVPGLKDIDILGALFRSRDYLSGESELVVLVTAYIAAPVGPGKLQTPADGMRVASDAETMLLGRLNSVYKAAPPAGRTYQGPYGHVIE